MLFIIPVPSTPVQIAVRYGLLADRTNRLSPAAVAVAPKVVARLEQEAARTVAAVAAIRVERTGQEEAAQA